MFSQSTELVIIQGGGIIKVNFHLVGRYGEGRGRLVLEVHSEKRQWTQAGKKEIPVRCKENKVTVKVVTPWRRCTNLYRSES